ncbi:MAG: hypothetical protein RPR97_19035, partial [Colwellia sp.]
MHWRVTLLAVLLFSLPLYAQKNDITRESTQQKLNEINQLYNIDIAITQLNKFLDNKLIPPSLRIDALLMQTKKHLDKG